MNYKKEVFDYLKSSETIKHFKRDNYNYYLIKKAEGKHYYESLTACSTKTLRMLYFMCKNNKRFLEE